MLFYYSFIIYYTCTMTIYSEVKKIVIFFSLCQFKTIISVSGITQWKWHGIFVSRIIHKNIWLCLK